MRLLITTAVVQTLVYGTLYWLNQSFVYGSSEQNRPILPMLALFAGSFLLYLTALHTSIRLKATSGLVWAIVLQAIVFRGILLPTTPIQEIDIYRYLWDGAATARGVNPYRYSPDQVLSAVANQGLPEDLQILVRLRDTSPVMADILARIHHAELPTVYPPVSQAVFALGDIITPNKSSVEGRVLILKFLLVLFDVGTIGLLWSLLVLLKLHPGWVIAYAWCPLVLKEFSNSGHLDSIAVFFTTATVWCVARLFLGGAGSHSTALLLGGGFTFAFAVGAKLYPVVLLPVWVAAVAARAGPKGAMSYGLLATVLSGVVVAPMLLTEPAESVALKSHPSDTDATESLPLEPRQDTGLKAFLTHWEMNDFLFMLVAENLRPIEPESERPHVWFAVLPNSWRDTLVAPLTSNLNIKPKTAAFLLTRVLTTAAFLAISLAFSWKVYCCASAQYFLEATFLTLAWFWLLSPTQNPWYWTWALPFLPFARGCPWMAVSGLTLLYYLRFWLRYHFSGIALLGTSYDGAQFFDFVLTWVEYLPWFLWLSISAWRRRHPSPVRGNEQR
jgi:hypothetical protein